MENAETLKKFIHRNGLYVQFADSFKLIFHVFQVETIFKILMSRNGFNMDGHAVVYIVVLPMYVNGELSTSL